MYIKIYINTTSIGVKLKASKEGKKENNKRKKKNRRIKKICVKCIVGKVKPPRLNDYHTLILPLTLSV